MKKLNDLINESNVRIPKEYEELNEILNSCGWPKIKKEDGKYKVIDENTIITFDIDDYDKKPYISKIVCNFVTADPAHLRDLNGLVKLFEKILKM